jgi:hypothetical protein
MDERCRKTLLSKMRTTRKLQRSWRVEKHMNSPPKPASNKRGLFGWNGNTTHLDWW